MANHEAVCVDRGAPVTVSFCQISGLRAPRAEILDLEVRVEAIGGGEVVLKWVKTVIVRLAKKLEDLAVQ